jgi:hypothetical protein
MLTDGRKKKRLEYALRRITNELEVVGDIPR